MGKRTILVVTESGSPNKTELLNPRKGHSQKRTLWSRRAVQPLRISLAAWTLGRLSRFTVRSVMKVDGLMPTDDWKGRQFSTSEAYRCN